MTARPKPALNSFVEVDGVRVYRIPDGRDGLPLFEARVYRNSCWQRHGPPNSSYADALAVAARLNESGKASSVEPLPSRPWAPGVADNRADNHAAPRVFRPEVIHHAPHSLAGRIRVGRALSMYDHN